MTKAESSKAGPVGHRRAPYATKACDVCRRKKTRCDETKPVCGSCAQMNRHAECMWTGEIVKAPRTEAFFEAQRKRIESLEAENQILRAVLEKCKQEHGGVIPDTMILHRQTSSNDSDGSGNENEEDNLHSGNDIGRELSVATESLRITDGGVVASYGTVAPFRFQEVQGHGSRISGIIEDPSAHYVLFLDHVDSSHIDFNLEWSRYLPASVVSSLMDRREHDRLLDLLFKFFTSWCLRVVPVLFLRDMARVLRLPRDQAPPRTTHYSPMLHNALMALATAFSDNSALRDIKNRRQFAQFAKVYIEEECEKPNISVVQALSLLGSFHSTNGDENLGYLYFGMSTRMAQILGLNVDCSKMVKAGLITHDDMLDRNWAHWTGFSLDVCWSLYVGRDCSVLIPLDGENIPVPFVDSEFDRIPFHHLPSNIPSQPSYLSKTFAATCNLLVIVRKVMEVVNRLHSPHKHGVSDETISRFDLELNTWKGDLPSELDLTPSSRNTATPHRLMMHLIYWLTFILLHRPFFHQKTRPIYTADKDIDHVKLCKRSADHITEILAAWQRLYKLRFVPVTLFQAVFSAGTVYLLLAVQAASGPRLAKSKLMDSLSRVDLCIQYLHEVGESWQSAVKIAEILRRLLQEQIKPHISNNLITPLRLDNQGVHDGDYDSPTSPNEFPYSPNTPPPISHSTSTNSNSSYESYGDPPSIGVYSAPVHAHQDLPPWSSSSAEFVEMPPASWMSDGQVYSSMISDPFTAPNANNFGMGTSYFQQQLQSFGPTYMPTTAEFSQDEIAMLNQLLGPQYAS